MAPGGRQPASMGQRGGLLCAEPRYCQVPVEQALWWEAVCEQECHPSNTQLRRKFGREAEARGALVLNGLAYGTMLADFGVQLTARQALIGLGRMGGIRWLRVLCPAPSQVPRASTTEPMPLSLPAPTGALLRRRYPMLCSPT